MSMHTQAIVENMFCEKFHGSTDALGCLATSLLWNGISENVCGRIDEVYIFVKKWILLIFWCLIIYYFTRKKKMSSEN